MICSCGNPKDFEKTIVSELKKNSNTDYVQTLLRISRSIAGYWDDEYKTELCVICEKLLKKNNLGVYQPLQENMQVNLEAIKIIGKYGNDEQILLLSSFEVSSLANKYLKALIYAYGIAGVNRKWVINNLKKVSDFHDVDKDTISIICKMLFENEMSHDDLCEIRKVLEMMLMYGRLKMTVIASAIIALGYSYIGTSDEIPHKVINSLMGFYNTKEYKHFETAIRIAKDLIDKGTISGTDTEYVKEVFKV